MSPDYARGKEILTGSDSGGIDRRLVNQQNWDAVADWVNTTTFGAFQAFAIALHRERFLAEWADENVEQILLNHERIVLQLPEYRVQILRCFHYSIVSHA